VVARPDADADAFLAFDSEGHSKRDTGRPARRALTYVLFVLGAIALVAAGALASYWGLRDRLAPPPATLPAASDGSVTVTSRPDGARVSIDGAPRGVTPLKATLAIGQHTIEVESGESRYSVPVTVEAGVSLSQYFDLAGPPPSTGRLEVTSDPAGAEVVIDGTIKGTTPFVVPAIAPGAHRVVIANAETTVNRNVTVNAGATASVVASLARGTTRTAAGLVTIQSPIELDILEGKKRLGTTESGVKLTPGRHVLELVAVALDFRATMSVDVPSSGTASAAVAVPNGVLSVNASPWAEVFVDGKSMGITPLANLSVLIGTHEILWRHPQFGERRQTVVVKAQTPVRIGMDFNR
jgi:PEGA domain